MACGDFRRRCCVFRSLSGEMGLGFTLDEADEAARHREVCERCDDWYRAALAEERPPLQSVPATSPTDCPGRAGGPPRYRLLRG